MGPGFLRMKAKRVLGATTRGHHNTSKHTYKFRTGGALLCVTCMCAKLVWEMMEHGKGIDPETIHTCCCSITVRQQPRFAVVSRRCCPVGALEWRVWLFGNSKQCTRYVEAFCCLTCPAVMSGSVSLSLAISSWRCLPCEVW